VNKTKALFNVVNHNLATINGTMGYDRITDTIIGLANAVHNDPEPDWYIGEGGEFCLDDLIIGAYWHFTEWHAGQYSKGYAALCALGQVFNPGMSTVEDENAAYTLLNDLAQNQ
jgi:hypothetical protein